MALMNSGKIEIVEAPLVKESEPLSKALSPLLREPTITVLVDDSARYVGIIDDRNIRLGVKDPKRAKASSFSVKAPTIKVEEIMNFELKDIISKFISGHFKALPVVDNNERVVGMITRAEVLRALLRENLVPVITVGTIMNTPPYIIYEGETLGKAKSLMKSLKAHRLIVVDKNNRVRGVVSTADFLMFLEKPNDRQSLQLITEVKRADQVKLSSILREPLVLATPSMFLPDLVREMADKNVSSAVVVEDINSMNKPLGVVTAMDVFKLILPMLEEKPSITVMGLGPDDIYYYSDVVEELEKLVEKFSKSFKIGKVELRVKKGKSVYEGVMRLEADNHVLRVKDTQYNLPTLIDSLTLIMDKELRKLKSKAKDHKAIAEVEVLEYEEFF